MESVVKLQYSHCKIAHTSWSFKHSNTHLRFPKTQTPKPSTTTTLSLCHAHFFSPSPLPPHKTSSSTEHTTLHVEPSHEYHKLRALLDILMEKDCCPLQLLRDDGDWTIDQFWAVIRFLIHASRPKEILQLFDIWRNIEKSRINEFNYSKIIGLLVEEDLIEEAVVCFQDMKSQGLGLSVELYNTIIHGLSRNGNFVDAVHFLNEMKEMNLAPDADTYDGLIEAYGKYKMYDEMGMCLKKMRLNGCSPDYITYNLLIREFAHGGLLNRVERVYQSMVSRRMDLQVPTLIAILEVYAKFGILEKMEVFYRRVLNSRAILKEDLIKKVAEVYIENYMFSKLENLGVDLSPRFGQTDLVWCLRLLSHAGLLSRRGMNSIILEMEGKSVPWNATVANIMMLAYLKMKDFTRLRSLFSQSLTRGVDPDIITFGILFDANRIGYDGSATLNTWRKHGILYKAVEMNTDPLVITTFGKGHFLRNCEAAYSSLEPEVREKKTWTYQDLIDSVFKDNQY
ncbi:PREDICTED: pentatricopeptide repeat-containing protein At4g14190, chloroplastic [Fragaria vesca subsp. vesca]|uniref:pentatricopeptide repeat-containing protein At4g14190, chloroplastic n=1 Tax=Fragaria vesca subsp. vesca TaxID=101020 RepID=UPI0002C35307|nr:PREDICTED: pentatricopeptide repeat-containing protein At4g14190, chloroplastic [Fragaria vesca subsp. vesca]